MSFIIITYLFLCQSPAHPREIMTRVLKVMQELSVRWKKIGHYNMKCLWIHGFQYPKSMTNNYTNANHYPDIVIPTNSDVLQTQAVVKFEIQVLFVISLCLSLFILKHGIFLLAHLVILT